MARADLPAYRPFMKIDQEDHGRKFGGIALMDVAIPERSEREDKELDTKAEAKRPGPVVGTRESEIRYRRLFEAARDGILILDPATLDINYANRHYVFGLGGAPL